MAVEAIVESHELHGAISDMNTNLGENLNEK